MVRILLTLLFIIISSRGAQSTIKIVGEDEYEIIYPPFPDINKITDVFSWDERKFFLCESHGCFLTVDNGKSWSFLNGKIKGLFNLSPQKVWTWGDKQIFYTDDGGVSWQKISETQENIRKVYFLNETEGFVLVGYGKLLRTIDGGKNWYNIPTLPASSEFWFRNNKEGYSIYNNTIYKSNNKGESWDRVFVGERPIQTYCIYSKYGIVIDDLGVIYMTKDGGWSWIELEIPAPTKFVKIDCNENGSGIGIGDYNKFLIFHNWGEKWLSREASKEFQQWIKNNENNDYCKDFLKVKWDGKSKNSFNKFTLIGCTGLFATEDGGINAVEIPIKIPDTSNGKVLFKKSFNSLLYSNDLGLHWQRLFAVNEKVVKVAMIKEGIGYAVTINGTVLKTQDYGEKWEIMSVVEVTPYEHLNSNPYFFFTDELNGWLIYNHDKAYYTKDGCVSWTIIKIPVYKGEGVEIKFFDKNKGVIYDSEYRSLYLTNDSGKSWVKKFGENIAYGYTPRANLKFIDPNRLILWFNENSALFSIDLKSEKHPENKIAITNNCAKKPIRMWWEDEKTGLYLVSEKTNKIISILLTNDGGKNCTKLFEINIADGIIKNFYKSDKKLIIEAGQIDYVNKVFISEDFGYSWRGLDLITPEGENVIGIGAINNDTLWFFTNLNKFWVSTNSGINWTQYLIIEPQILFGDLQMINDKIWITPEFMTTNGGKTWGKSPWALCPPFQKNVKFVPEEILLSDNIWQLFSECEKALSNKSSEVYKFEIDKAKPISVQLEKNKSLIFYKYILPKWELRLLFNFIFPNKILSISENGMIFQFELGKKTIDYIGSIFDYLKKAKIESLGPIYFANEQCGCTYALVEEEDDLSSKGIFCTKDGGVTWYKSKVKIKDNRILDELIENIPVELFNIEEDDIEEEKIEVIKQALKSVTGIQGAVFYLEDCKNGWGLVADMSPKRSFYSEDDNINIYLVKTTDGGQKWKSVNKIEKLKIFLESDDDEPPIIEFRNNKIWLANRGKLFKIEENGKRWNEEILPIREIRNISKIYVKENEVYIQAHNFILRKVDK